MLATTSLMLSRSKNEKQERVHRKFLALCKAGSPYLPAAKVALEEVLKMTEG